MLSKETLLKLSVVKLVGKIYLNIVFNLKFYLKEVNSLKSMRSSDLSRLK